jgi:hypothetical protein
LTERRKYGINKALRSPDVRRFGHSDAVRIHGSWATAGSVFRLRDRGWSEVIREESEDRGSNDRHLGSQSQRAHPFRYSGPSYSFQFMPRPISILS